VWKTAGGRDDGQDQESRHLAVPGSSPVHVSDSTDSGAVCDRFQEIVAGDQPQGIPLALGTFHEI
jgi:hypothetical protein